MSRSKRKSPIAGITTAKSEKDDKRIANRSLRRLTKGKLDVDSESSALPTLREVSDTWAMQKDGKRRFSPTENPRLMRK